MFLPTQAFRLTLLPSTIIACRPARTSTAGSEHRRRKFVPFGKFTCTTWMPRVMNPVRAFRVG